MKCSGKVILMAEPAAEKPERQAKTVAPTQAALDALPFNSGCWKVENSMALYVRCRAQSKSFFVQRRIRGRLVQKVIGPVSMAEARRRAAKLWREMRPAPEETRRLTLKTAVERYIEEKDLSPKTEAMLRFCLKRYLQDISNRTLHDIGQDRAGVRRMLLRVKATNGPSAAYLASSWLCTIFNYWRRIDLSLPESPTRAVDLPHPRPRDAALPPETLRDLWTRIQKLSPALRVAWQLLIFTGARKSSVMALRWSDVDLDAGTVFFSEAKGDRTYRVPLCKRLVAVLREWKEQCPPSENGWLFPSPVRHGEHISDCLKKGLPFPHSLRHTYRTALAAIGAPYDASRLLLGRALPGVSGGYVTRALVTESLREWSEKVAQHYARILGLEDGHAQA
jgi:integrase